MQYINYFYDDIFPDDVDSSVKRLDRKQASGKERFKARRKIEDIRENRRLKRQLDPYGTDY